MFSQINPNTAPIPTRITARRNIKPEKTCLPRLAEPTGHSQ